MSADEASAPPELTVLFPCLNEEAAIGECVDRAWEVIKRAQLDAEVLVVDNDSTDRSAEIAREHGARVVVERRRGYGSAYLRGFQEARGELIVMLDADGTYPYDAIPDFTRLLRDGAQMVVGNRFGGKMERDAMPLLNRVVGNPVLSAMTRLLFRVGLKDIHCGMRGIRRSVIPDLHLQTPGMEFATEMIVKALDHGLRFEQLDIAYHPRVGESKLRPFRDAWRHMEYMLVFSPVALFLAPGLLLSLLGTTVQLLLLAGPQAIFSRVWDVHTNLAGLAAALTGNTLVVLGIVSCAYSWSVRMQFRHSRVARWVSRNGGRFARVAGLASLLVGISMWCSIVVSWIQSGFGPLHALPFLSLASTLAAMGLELLGAAFLVHIISLRR